MTERRFFSPVRGSCVCLAVSARSTVEDRRFFAGDMENLMQNPMRTIEPNDGGAAQAARGGVTCKQARMAGLGPLR